MHAEVDSDDPLAAGLGYADLVWWIVPTAPRSKHPRLQAWQEAASANPEQITEWWGSRYQGDGISIVCGPSGLVVIDVDCHGPIDGEDTLADLEATYGKLPHCPTVLTGGGGRHLYFRAPADRVITNDAGRRLGPGLDVRAQGGQVVAPPSLHESGQRYQWEASSRPCELALFAKEGEVAVPPLPDWLVGLLTEAPEIRPAPSRPKSGEARLPGEQWAAVTEWATLLGENGATYLGRRVDHRSGEGYELWARPGVTDHISATLGYGGSDVLKVFSTNWPGLDAEATYTKFGFLAATRHGGDFKAARAALEAEGFKLKPEDTRRYVDPEALIHKADPEAGAGKDRLASMVDAEWLMRQHFPPLRYHVPYLVPEGSTLLVGPPKVGKSWLVLNWSLDIAAGRPILGSDERVAARPVLYLALEDSLRRLQNRLRMLTLPGQVFPQTLKLMVDVEPNEIIDLMVDWLDRYGDDGPLVILDTLGKVLPPSVSGESSYQRDYRISGALKRMIDRVDGAALIINHHDRKAGAEDFIDAVSGTHGLAGAADTTIVLARKRHSSEALLQVTGRDVEESAFALDFDRGAWVLRGRDFQAAMKAAAQMRTDSNLGGRALSVLDFLEDQPEGARYRDIETALGFQPGKELRRLTDAGQVRKAARGLYVVPPPSQTPSSPTPPGGSIASSPPTPQGEEGVSGGSGDQPAPVCRFIKGSLWCQNGPDCPNPNHRGPRRPTTEGDAP